MPVDLIMHPTLANAIAALRTPDSSISSEPQVGASPVRPSSADLVEALLETEKAARKQRSPLTFDQLIGTWQLRFITGTTRSRQQAKMVLGSGRFIPTWLLQLQLEYAAVTEDLATDDLATDNLATEEQGGSAPAASDSATIPAIIPATIPATIIGSVRNSVTIGPLSMVLTGPTRLWPKTNSLAFDFTHIAIAIAGTTLYEGDIRGGQQRAQEFAQQSLKDQAFFTYFWVDEQAIAARGRGGGLALWTRKH